MKQVFLLIAAILILHSCLLNAQNGSPIPLQLNLEKGDSLIYEIKSSSSRSEKRYNGDIYRMVYEDEARISFRIENVPEPGSYLIKYKVLYHRYSRNNPDRPDYGDSRFPDYGTRYSAVAQGYLNTVEYEVLFKPEKNLIQVKNLEEIRSGMISCIESRGLTEGRSQNEDSRSILNEEMIRSRVQFLNLFPSAPTESEWIVKHADGASEQFSRVSANDSTQILSSQIPGHVPISFGRHYAVEGMHTIRDLTLDSKTGLILHGKEVSFTDHNKRATSEQLNENNTLADYQYDVKLISYSKWARPTVLCGILHIPGIERLALLRNTGIIGNSYEQKLIETTPDGSFALKLELMDVDKYVLYFLEDFPIDKNQGVQLFISPGDSIFLDISRNEEETEIIFSGRAYKDSEFLYKNNFNINSSLIFSLYNYRHPQMHNFSRYTDQIKTNINTTRENLSTHRKELSEDFICYMNSELESLEKSYTISKFWELQAKGEIGFGTGSLPDSLKLHPLNPEPRVYSMLNQYRSYVDLYTTFRIRQFQIETNGTATIGSIIDQTPFVNILLKQIPLYMINGSFLESRLYFTGDHTRTHLYFDEFFNSCNNHEMRAHFQKRYATFNSIQPGNKIDPFPMQDLKGRDFDWSNTEGKVVVLMLFKDYSREHFFSEEIYKEFGENKDDVLVFRISPGLDHAHWKDFNIRYSEGQHQMYYTNGELDMKERFLLSQRTYLYLVLDKNGNICKSPRGPSQLRGAIALAQKVPLIKERSVFFSMLTKILPGMVLGILITIILYRLIIRRRLEKKALLQKMTELEQKAMKAQLNPHFLFNSLNSIQNLIRSNKGKEADGFLSKFATLIRKVLNNSEKESISISEELSVLQIYLELEQMRFEFNFSIDPDPTIDIYNTMMPAMLLQPLVENAILHGLEPKARNKILTIKIVPINDSIQFIIDDNGVGRKPSLAPDPENEGRGLKITESRIELLNKLDPGKFKIELIDKKEAQSGTTVIITVPDEK